MPLCLAYSLRHPVERRYNVYFTGVSTGKDGFICLTSYAATKAVECKYLVCLRKPTMQQRAARDGKAAKRTRRVRNL